MASEAADRGDEAAAIAWALREGFEPGAVLHGVRLYRGTSPVLGWPDELLLLEYLGHACSGPQVLTAASARILAVRRQRAGSERAHRTGVACDAVGAFLRGYGTGRSQYDTIIRELAAQAGRERVGTRLAASLPNGVLALLAEAPADAVCTLVRENIEGATLKEIEGRLRKLRGERRTSAIFRSHGKRRSSAVLLPA